MSYFHRHEESKKTVTASPEKTYDEVHLPVTTNSFTATPFDVPEVINSLNNCNTTISTFNINLGTPIPSCLPSFFLRLDLEKKDFRN